MSQTDKSQAPFPTTLADVTASWLASTLQTAGALTATDRVVDFEAIPLGEGYGMLGNLARLVLRYADGAGPVASVIFKCATSSEANRAVAATFDMFNREFSFYKTLAPRVSELIPDVLFRRLRPRDPRLQPRVGGPHRLPARRPGGRVRRGRRQGVPRPDGRPARHMV